VAVLIGAAAGLAAPGTPIGAVVFLGLLGVALASPSTVAPPGASRWGLLVAVGALGLLAGVLAGDRPAVPDPMRPVAAVARVTGHWRQYADSWSAPVRILRLRQGNGVEIRGRDASLRLPGVEPPPPLGTRLRVRGFLRRAPALGNVPALPPGPWHLTTKSRRLVSVGQAAGWLGASATALRRRVERGIERAGTSGAVEAGGAGPSQWSGNPEEDREPAERRLALALVRALVLGDASRVPLQVRQGLRRLGLAHVLAVSGLHVGLAAGVLLALGAGLPRGPRLALGLAGVGLYLLLVGPRPSLLRASVMACLAVAALLAERPPEATNALAVAAGALCLMSPRVLLDAGFRLTVGATAGIVLFGPRLAARWTGGAGGNAATRGRIERLRDGVLRTLAVSVGAQIGVLPWALPLFCVVTPWAPLANLVAVPWTGLALAVCLAWSALAAVWPALAGSLAGAVDRVAAPFAWPAAIAPRPWIDLPVSLGTLGAASLAAGLLLVLGGAGTGVRRRWPRQVGLVLVVALVVVAGGASWADGGDDGVSAVVIDVGQGDAILLRDGAHAVLVDGGGWRFGDLGGRVLLPVLARLGVRRLEGVIATHPDRDHCGGLVDIAGYLAVARAFSGPGIGASRCGRDLAALPAVARRVVSAGDRLHVGRWSLRVLSPPRLGEGPGGGSDGGPGAADGGDNDNSLVIAAEAFGRRLLLTGDIEAPAERALVRSAVYSAEGALRCDVLKVAHHGSRTSTGKRFLDAAAPRIALISAGEHNPYGHPAVEVLDRLRARGVRVYRTDRDGMVVVVFHPDGRLSVRLPAAPKP